MHTACGISRGGGEISWRHRRRRHQEAAYVASSKSLSKNVRHGKSIAGSSGVAAAHGGGGGGHRGIGGISAHGVGCARAAIK